MALPLTSRDRLLQQPVGVDLILWNRGNNDAWLPDGVRDNTVFTAAESRPGSIGRVRSYRRSPSAKNLGRSCSTAFMNASGLSRAANRRSWRDDDRIDIIICLRCCVLLTAGFCFNGNEVYSANQYRNIVCGIAGWRHGILVFLYQYVPL